MMKFIAIFMLKLNSISLNWIPFSICPDVFIFCVIFQSEKHIFTRFFAFVAQLLAFSPSWAVQLRGRIRAKNIVAETWFGVWNWLFIVIRTKSRVILVPFWVNEFCGSAWVEEWWNFSWNKFKKSQSHALFLRSTKTTFNHHSIRPQLGKIPSQLRENRFFL